MYHLKIHKYVNFEICIERVLRLSYFNFVICIKKYHIENFKINGLNFFCYIKYKNVNKTT